MSLVPNPCPSDRDEIAEQYAMGKLTGEDAAAFEKHILLCAACAQAAEAALAYVRAMRDAGKKLRGGSEPPSES